MEREKFERMKRKQIAMQKQLHEYRKKRSVNFAKDSTIIHPLTEQPSDSGASSLTGFTFGYGSQGIIKHTTSPSDKISCLTLATN